MVQSMLRFKKNMSDGYRQERSEDVLYRVRELGPTNHVKGNALLQWILLVLCQQQEFACFRMMWIQSFGLALTSSDEFLPRSNMVQSVHVAFQKEHVRWSRNVNTVKRGQKMYRVRELGPTNHVKGMLWFNGSCWCCVNSKILFACQNAAAFSVESQVGWISGKIVFFNSTFQPSQMLVYVLFLPILKCAVLFPLVCCCFYSFICSAAVQVYFIVNIVDLCLLSCCWGVWLMTIVRLMTIVLTSQWWNHHISSSFMVKSQCLVLKSASFNIFHHVQWILMVKPCWIPVFHGNITISHQFLMVKSC